MESTYGDRLHENKDLSDQLEYWINKTLKDRGNIIIPCFFAVGQAQEIMYILQELKTKIKSQSVFQWFWIALWQLQPPKSWSGTLDTLWLIPRNGMILLKRFISQRLY